MSESRDIKIIFAEIAIGAIWFISLWVSGVYLNSQKNYSFEFNCLYLVVFVAIFLLNLKFHSIFGKYLFFNHNQKRERGKIQFHMIVFPLVATSLFQWHIEAIQLYYTVNFGKKSGIYFSTVIDKHSERKGYKLHSNFYRIDVVSTQYNRQSIQVSLGKYNKLHKGDTVYLQKVSSSQGYYIDFIRYENLAIH